MLDKLSDGWNRALSYFAGVGGVSASYFAVPYFLPESREGFIRMDEKISEKMGMDGYTSSEVMGHFVEGATGGLLDRTSGQYFFHLAAMALPMMLTSEYFIAKNRKRLKEEEKLPWNKYKDTKAIQDLSLD